MSMSSIHVFDGGVIPDSESSGGSSGSANIKNLIMRDFDLNLEGETVSSKILCDYNSPQESVPYYAPVSIEDMARWTKDGFNIQVRLESQPSVAANLGFLARVSITHDSTEDEVTDAKIITYERLDDHRIKFNILNFDKVTDEVTSIDYLKLSEMDEFTLDSSIDMTVEEILAKIPSTATASNKLVTEQQLENATASMESGYTPKGPASVSTLNGLTGQENGDQYIVTDSGTLTYGSLAVTAGESVAWDSANDVWYKVNQYALKSGSTTEIYNLPDKRDGYLVLNDANDTGKMAVDTIFNNFAEKFIPNSTTTVANQAYVYAGNMYLAKESGYNGLWNANKFIRTDSSLCMAGRLIKLVGIAYNSQAAGVEKDGDIYFNTSTHLLRRCVSYSRNIYETVPFFDGAIYQHEGCLYYYDGVGSLVNVKNWKFRLKNLVSVGMDSGSFIAAPSGVLAKTESSGNYCKCTYVVSNSYTGRLNYSKVDFDQRFVSGHKYYFGCDVRPSVDSYARMYSGDSRGSDEVFKKDVWSHLSNVSSVVAHNEWGVYVWPTNRSYSGDYFEIKNCAVFDLTEVFGSGNEPDERFIDQILYGKDVTKNENVYFDYSADLFLNDTVFFCDKEAVDKNGCVICNGYADDVKINHYIQNTNFKKFVFKSGSIFNIRGPIVIRRDDLVFEGYGAKIKMSDVAEVALSNFRLAANQTDWIAEFTKTVENADDVESFYDGVTIEVYNPGATQNNHSTHGTSKISVSTESNGQFRIAPANDIFGFQIYQFATGAKIRTVSSVFDVRNCNNVTVRGFECDLNVENNRKCLDTFDTQNGLHFYQCNGCVIENCNFHDGGRHGILFSSSTNCAVRNCKLNNWGEHGIDLAWHFEVSPVVPCYHEASGNVCTNNTICGIQLHRGAHCIVKDNICKNNGSAGVGMQEGATENIITNNILENNQDGVYGYTNVNNCIVSANKISGSTRNGIEFEGSCEKITIVGNLIKESAWNGIRCTGNCTGIDIKENTVIDSTPPGGSHIYDIQLNNTKKSVVLGNTVRNTVSLSTYAIGESGDSSNSNLIAENTVFGKDKVVGNIDESSVNRNNISFV